VWVNAAAQNFYSIGIAFGSVISFASYNRSNNQILVDTLTVSVINGVTSLLVGVFAFATIGNIATEHQTTIDNVISDGNIALPFISPFPTPLRLYISNRPTLNSS
jgi:solute carrier family 6 GABA transporter-like protein 6/8/11/12/13